MVNFAAALEFTQPVNRADALDHPQAHAHTGTHSLDIDIDLDPYLDLANLINDQADRSTDKNTAGFEPSEESLIELGLIAP
jgi:hypothetical protein